HRRERPGAHHGPGAVLAVRLATGRVVLRQGHRSPQAGVRGARREARRGRLMAVKPADPQAVVIFGASGDLTRRKLLPAFYHLFVEGLLPDGFAIVGYARSEMSDEDFREATRQALKQYARCDPGGEEWEEFHRRIAYVRG